MPSRKRWRVPALICDKIVCVWIRPSLGLLLGRDFLDAVEAVIDFSAATLTCRALDGSPMKLERLSAGHLALKLIPEKWPALGKQFRWRRLGPDGVLEFPLHCRLWAEQLMRARRRGQALAPAHDHNLTEASLQLGNLAFTFHAVLCAAAQASMHTSTTLTSPSSSQHGGQPFGRCASWARRFLQARGRRGRRAAGDHAVAAAGGADGEAPGLGKARSQSSVPTYSVSVPLYLLSCCLALAGGVHDPIRSLASEMVGPYSVKDAFVEDPILLGMLAVRRGPPTTARIRNQVAEAQAQAALEEDKLKAARALLGPRHGLPTLRADLLRLAALLHVVVEDKDTVDKLKTKLRPLAAEVCRPYLTWRQRRRQVPLRRPRGLERHRLQRRRPGHHRP